MPEEGRDPDLHEVRKVTRARGLAESLRVVHPVSDGLISPCEVLSSGTLVVCGGTTQEKVLFADFASGPVGDAEMFDITALSEDSR